MQCCYILRLLKITNLLFLRQAKCIRIALIEVIDARVDNWFRNRLSILYANVRYTTLRKLMMSAVK